MDAKKLFGIAKELSNNIITSGILNQLTNILGIANSIQQGGQLQLQQRQNLLGQIDAQRELVASKFATFIPSTVSEEDSKIYELIGAYNLFGRSGIERFNSCFDEMRSNPAVTIPKINSYMQDVHNISNLYNAFAPFYSQIVSQKIEDENQILIYFPEDASMYDLKDLSEIASEWNVILRSFVLLSGESDTSFKVRSVEHGSLIVIVMAIATAVYATAKAVDKILDVFLKAYKIKKLMEDAKKVNVLSPGAISIIEEESKVDSVTQTKRISQELLIENPLKAGQNEHEVLTALNMSVGKIIEHYDKGGNIEVKFVGSNSDGQKVEMELKLKYHEIKKIEADINAVVKESNLLERKDHSPSDSPT